MPGMDDISNLFSRVSALEQDEADSDTSITRIFKLYNDIEVKATITISKHQYKICGEQEQVFLSPDFPSVQYKWVCSPNTII